MIKLRDILNEEFPKNKFVQLSKQDIETNKQVILDLIANAYKPAGGNPEFKVADDVLKSDINIWIAADIDKDPEIDIAIGSKKKPAGIKVSTMGQDGEPDAKKQAIQKMSSLLSKKGYYAEVSPDLARKFNLDPIEDQEIVKKVVAKPDIEFQANGLYTRKIDGIMRTKVLIGHPLVVGEAYKPMSRSKVMKMRRARRKPKTGKRKAQLRKARLKYRRKKSVIRRKSQQRKRRFGSKIKAAAKRRNL